jgi:hypothetical protein
LNFLSSTGICSTASGQFSFTQFKKPVSAGIFLVA